MLIYSNNLAEKLFGYAISKEYLKYSSPFCDLLDDPNLKVDFDLAVNFNKGLNGDLEAARIFTEDLIINGPSLDVSTINFYVNKMYQFPIFHGEIERVHYVFGFVNRIKGSNDISGESRFANKLKNALLDCLNSPCNYFAQNSNSVGKLAEATANMNNGTMPPFKELFGEFTTAIGGMGKDLFNKIPAAFQKSTIELAAIGQAAFAQSINMFVKDDTAELLKKARGKISLRGGTEAKGYIYTPDFKSYLDHSAASSNILTKVAGSMGDCFRQYQHSYRYNPYNPDMNLSMSNKVMVSDQSNGTVFERDITGQIDSAGGTNSTNQGSLGVGGCGGGGGVSGSAGGSYSQDSESYATPSTQTGSSTGEVLYEFTVGATNNKATVFGGWYDIEDTGSPSGKTVWGDDFVATSADKNTIAGVGIHGKKYIFCPSTPGTVNGTELGSLNGYVKLINDGYVSNDKYDSFDSKKFNHGVALKSADVRAILAPKGLKARDCVVEINYNGKILKNVNVIDQGGLAPNTRLDLTPYMYYAITGSRPSVKKTGPEATLSDGSKVRTVIATFDQSKLVGMTVKVFKKGSTTTTSTGADSTGKGTGNITYSLNGIRNLPIKKQLEDILQGAAAEVKVDLVVYSGGQVPGRRPKGASTRHDYGWAADLWIHSGGRRLNSSNPNDIPLLTAFTKALRRRGATGIGMGNGYMGNTGMHVDIAYGRSTQVPPNCWGGAGKNSAGTPGWLRQAFSSYN